MKSISIVTAAFNECPGIIQLANEWLTFFDQHPDISEGEVIICDDHSDLHQYESLRDAFIGNHRVVILRNEVNEGPGFSFQKAISHAKGNVSQAAKALGISRATLYRKLSRKNGP